MARSSGFRTWDDYFIPGTSVLRNKFVTVDKPYGETDPTILRTLEERMSAVRIAELRAHPIEGRFDYDHMKAIHRAIFQDVYDWAGQERVAPTDRMTKDGHAYYSAGPALTAAAEAEYAKLASKDYLRGLQPKEFVDELAESWGEVNVIHSFREGNTRSQFVFFSQLAEQAGYRIDAAQFVLGAPLRDAFVEARFHSQDTGRNNQLASVLGQAIVPFDRGMLPLLDQLVDDAHTMAGHAFTNRADSSYADALERIAIEGKDLATDRARLTAALDPLLSEAGEKIASLYRDADVRDFLAVDEIRTSGTFTDEQLLSAGRERAAGFDLATFAHQLTLIGTLTAEQTADHDLNETQLEGLQNRFESWAVTIRRSLTL
ncbi:Fic/DOC family protein [Rathayibacter toxicus]|uniref:protein adenylyltransferase n=1 Tax=Rathayibacter toxicus TaxID=145458 RepID=A0A2S5Y984_9MICO|nr:Fic family protein [Rathayibacter toxicus]PPG23332.1 hypothetical protein C5D15_03615 [Rathayibacter toxicus]PPG47916.1 hypothetical protein C5D16_03615 [Rathayibacter toxicus]PPH25057.1 hypothetical protein C5D17_03595 [Rathayibacter toxicus]PPH58984.1 hypothetical protein C5D30_03610 [Rathayibacter toxicus]PPH60978.1 hypothetical protein C5C93_03645 [Rathayibacter toxicus]